MAKETEPAGHPLTEALNRDCFCISLDKAALHASLEEHLMIAGLPERLLDEHSHLFADSPVFLSHGHLQEMRRLIRAIDDVAHNENFRDAVLAGAPNIARYDFGPRGVFMGYDFHLGADGPRLIEINTNSGGTLLTHYLAAAQKACCEGVFRLLGGATEFADVENELIAMFRSEWQLQRPDNVLRTIAIVDRQPSAQFLHPEFLLFRSLFERHGIEAVIADPGDLALRNDALWSGDVKIDLVYNRLTDFYLEQPQSSCLRRAYEEGAAVVTPHPHVYALYADKRNLPLLSDSDRLRDFGVDDETVGVLRRSVPSAEAVTPEIADRLWHDRKRLFFKPATGHGSRGAYRGAKLTRRVWENIREADYIAQAIVPPSTRQLIINGDKKSLKLDVRCVAYGVTIQQLSARLYEGQTTNLRTEGGGLATVFSTPKGS